MNVVAQRYGYSVHYEVLNDKVGAGVQRRPRTRPSCASPARRASPRRTRRPKARSPSTRPSRSIPRSRSATCPHAEVERVTTEVDDAAIDKTDRDPAQAAPHLRRSARRRRRRRRRPRRRSTSKARSTASRSTAARPRTSSSSSAKARCCEQFDDAVRGMKVGESQDLPAPVPGRLPRQGRGRQAKPTSWSP